MKISALRTGPLVAMVCAIILAVPAVAAPSAGELSSLNPGQAVAIQAQVAARTASFATSACKKGVGQASFQAAVSDVEIASVGQYGALLAGSVTSALMASPALASCSGDVVGTGLGLAAVRIANVQGIGVAIAIAQTVANEGPSGSQKAFARAVIGAGGPQALADVALGPPVVTSALTARPTAGKTSPSVYYGTSCANPSCS